MASLRKLRHVHYSDETREFGFFEHLPCHPKQAAFIAGSTRRHQYFLGGIGTGKTKALGRKALYLALAQPGVTGALLGRTGNDIQQTVFPSFWEDVELLQQSSGLQIVTSHNKGERSVSLANGSRILFRPYDQVDKLRGLNLAFAGMDEIEYCLGDPGHSFNVVNGRVRRGRPGMRQVFCVSTPNGLRGAVELFLSRLQGGSRRYFVQHATVFDNPWIFDDDACETCHGARELDGSKCWRCGGCGRASEYIDALREGCSARMWRQEGEGRVLKPVAAIFDEYDEATHLIRWQWRDDLPWVLCIDWGGPAHAYFSAVQVTDKPIAVDGRALPPGSWVVAYEEKHDQISRGDFRDRIRRFVMARGNPYWSGSDRAVTDENRWLKRALRGCRYTKWCESKTDQSVRHGVGMLQYMLRPLIGPPRLYVSRDLPRTTGKAGVGLRGALLGYQHVVDPRNPDLILEDIAKDGITDHPIDALRYGVVTSARHKPLHGGAALAYVTAREIVGQAA